MDSAGKIACKFFTKSKSPIIETNPIIKPSQPVNTENLENIFILCFVSRAVIKVAVALIPKTKRKEGRSKKTSISPVFIVDNIMP